MRLWLSVAVLLVLACVVIEISAAKSNRDADVTKDYHKSGNSKEVRYSKNKSDVKQKGSGKKQEIIREKKQRYNAEGNEKINTKDIAKENQDKRNIKVSHEEQKRQKSNKENKIGKNVEKLKDNKNIKVTKDSGKRQKRSAVEFEQPKDSLINEAADSPSKKEESRSNTASKNSAKNKFEKKTRNGNVDGIEEVSADNKPSKKESDFSENKNVKSSRKNKNSEEQYGNSKNTKKQKQSHNSEKLKKSDSTEKKIQSSEEPAGLNEMSESLNDLANDNSADSNGDGFVKEEKSRCENVKKQKISKKSSKTESHCEREVDDCEVAKSDTQKHIAKESQKYKSDSCALETEDSIVQNRSYDEEQKAKDIEEESITENEESTEEDEDEGIDVQAKNYMRIDSVKEDVIEEIIGSME